MKVANLAKHYACLTPEERFRLILAAGARGDEAEQQRLLHAGQSITLTTSDHAPWARAFDELALLIFLEILEDAANHGDAYEQWSDSLELSLGRYRHETEVNQDEESEGEIEDEEETDLPNEETACADVVSTTTDEEESMVARTRDLYLAQGFLLKTKIAGWKLFCEHLSIPPFALWQLYPGFERLKLAMELLEDNEYRPCPAFCLEGMLRWLRRIRPKDAPPPSIAKLITPENFANELDKAFRTRVEWWGG